MPKIPLLIKPEDDEIMFSYMWRLSLHNGFNDLTDFYHSFLWPNKKNVIVRLDGNDVFSAFFKAVDVEIDKTRFYLDHTIYAGIVPVSSQYYQMNIVAQAFRENPDMQRICGYNINMIDALKACPECMKEDKEKIGFWYYHKAHHMPGVMMCAEHAIPLEARIILSKHNNAKNVRPFDDEAFQLKVNDENWGYKYSVFLRDLLEAELDTDLSEISEDMSQGIELQVDDNIIEYENKPQKQNMRISRLRMYALMVKKYKDVKTLKKKTLDNKKSFTQQKGYKLISKHYRPLLEIQNTETEETFITTEKGFFSGWREYSADKSAEEKFKEIFYRTTDGTYKLESEFKKLISSVTVHHETCGRTLKIEASSLLKGRRCVCDKKNITDAIKFMDDEIQYENTGQKPCEIIKRIGEFDEKNLESILNPLCLKFNCLERFSKKNIRQKIKDLVGDEYDIVSIKNKDEITLRHNECGEIRVFKSSEFLRGIRCTCKNSSCSEEKFKKYVEEVSGGKYIIGEKIKTNIFEVINTETGDIKTFERPFILQELRRPTPSKALELKEKFQSKAMMSEQEIIMDYIYHRYSFNDYFFSDELKNIDGVPSKNIGANLKILTDQKKRIFRVYEGRPSIYAYHDIKLTFLQAMHIKYIERNRAIIGFYRSDSLLFNLKLIPEKPSTVKMYSNAVNKEMSLEKDNTAVNIRGYHILITNDNYITLQYIETIYENHRRKLNKDAIIYLLGAVKEITRESIDTYLPYYPDRVQKAVNQFLEGKEL